MSETEEQLKEAGISLAPDYTGQLYYSMEYSVGGRKSYYRTTSLLALLLQIKNAHVLASEAIVRMNKKLSKGNPSATTSHLHSDVRYIRGKPELTEPQRVGTQSRLP